MTPSQEPPRENKICDPLYFSSDFLHLTPTHRGYQCDKKYMVKQSQQPVNSTKWRSTLRLLDTFFFLEGLTI